MFSPRGWALVASKYNAIFNCPTLGCAASCRVRFFLFWGYEIDIERVGVGVVLCSVFFFSPATCIFDDDNGRSNNFISIIEGVCCWVMLRWFNNSGVDSSVTSLLIIPFVSVETASTFAPSSPVAILSPEGAKFSIVLLPSLAFWQRCCVPSFFDNVRIPLSKSPSSPTPFTSLDVTNGGAAIPPVERAFFLCKAGDAFTVRDVGGLMNSFPRFLDDDALADVAV